MQSSNNKISNEVAETKTDLAQSTKEMESLKHHQDWEGQSKSTKDFRTMDERTQNIRITTRICLRFLNCGLIMAHMRNYVYMQKK